jgi:hypothetical protein
MGGDVIMVNNVIKFFEFDSRNGKFLKDVIAGCILKGNDGINYQVISEQPLTCGCNNDGSIWGAELEVTIIGKK